LSEHRALMASYTMINVVMLDRSVVHEGNNHNAPGPISRKTCELGETLAGVSLSC
jgi:hypothetical protein